MITTAESSVEQGLRGADLLERTVIEGGRCIGCGACAVVAEARFSIEETEHGFLRAKRRPISPDGEDLSLEVCPHGGFAPDEDALGAELFAAVNNKHDRAVGYWQFSAAFALRDDADRLAGSSGGGVTWMLRELMRHRVINSVVHVKALPSVEKGRQYGYAISHSIAEIEKGRKSAYYPVTLEDVLLQMRRAPGRYALVAVPCFAKAIRLLARQDPVLRERIGFVVGIVCGHLKSRFYGEYLGWCAGVPPKDQKSIDFRVKRPCGGAGDYGIRVTTGRGDVESRRLADYFGTPWELGFMMYEACDSCDDVFCETADVVFGDAWIAPYERDWRGHNVVISRNPVSTRILRAAMEDPRVEIDEIELNRIVESQAGALRHRREGLSYRLASDMAARRWIPQKRVMPDLLAVPISRAKLLDARRALSALSVLAFAEAKRRHSLCYFKARMSGPVFFYYLNTLGWRVAIRQSAPFKFVVRLFRRK